MNIGQLIGILVILTLLLVGATFIFNQQHNTSFILPFASVGSSAIDVGSLEHDQAGTTVTTEVIHIVEYDVSGFQPNNLVLQAGESVRFQNLGEELMWVTHEDSPGCMGQQKDFDQCAPGVTFEHTFTFEGEWTFFNELNPNHQGFIKVE